MKYCPYCGCNLMLEQIRHEQKRIAETNSVPLESMEEMAKELLVRLHDL